MDVTFISSDPRIPSDNIMFMLEAMTYKVTIAAKDDEIISQPRDDIIVQVWTNQYHAGSTEGTLHAIDLQHQGTSPSNPGYHVFAKSMVITNASDFKFTFRMKPNKESPEWMWFGEYGTCRVHTAKGDDKYNQGPDFDHITDSVYLGNFMTATYAQECGMTHVLNVADNRDMVYDHQDIVYRKIGLKDGAANVIPEECLLEAVEWINAHNIPGNKLVVNCRAGMGRSGSVVVAYIFAKNMNMTFEEAFEYVNSKRKVYMHKGLEESVQKLFRN